MFLKILYIVLSLNSNGKRPATSFLEKDEVIFHLAAISKCEGGGKGHTVYGTQLMRFRQR
jgi:hypothetical protein